jgi:ketosteroid isomerase-like protein
VPSDKENPLVIAYFRMIRAFNENDLEAVRALIHEDVIYTIPGRSPIGGTARGISQHLAQLQSARALSNNTLRLEPTDVVASEERLFVYGRITAQRGDKRLDSEHLVVFRFEGGRIVEGRTVPVDLYEFDAFWAEPLTAAPKVP